MDGRKLELLNLSAFFPRYAGANKLERNVTSFSWAVERKRGLRGKSTSLIGAQARVVNILTQAVTFLLHFLMQS